MRESFGVDTAFISLVDAKRVIYISIAGKPPVDSDKVFTLCTQTVATGNPTILKNRVGEYDEAFNDSVNSSSSQSALVFYADACLMTADGRRIGTVSLAHPTSHEFDDREQQMLNRFARLAMQVMEGHENSKSIPASSPHRHQTEYQTINPAYRLFLQAPVAISIYKGEDLVIELANDAALRLSGKTKDILGKKLNEVIPEIEAFGYIDLLKEVYRTGKIVEASEAPVILKVHGEEKLFYFNFIYQPSFDEAGNIDGVLTMAIDVTEQVQGRLKIEVSEQKFRNVLEQSPYPILILKGPDMVLEVANQPLFDLWNVDKSAIGLPFLEILPEMKSQGFWDLLQEVYRVGKPHHGYETPAYFIRNNERKLYYFNFVYEPYKEKDGSISGVLILSVDVTDQIIAKQKQAESEAHFRSMILQAPVGICIIRKKGFIIEIANKQYTSLMNITGEHLEGSNIMEKIPEARSYKEIITQVFDSGQAFYAVEHSVEFIRGELREHKYLDFVIEPLKEETGAIDRVMILVIDVSEKVEARQQIELTETRASLAVESAEMGTFDLDLVTYKIYGSRRLKEIFGLDDAFDRDRFLNAIHPDDHFLRKAAFDTAYKTGVLEYEVRVIRKDESIRWIKVKGRVSFLDNKPKKVYGVVMDVTEQKEFSGELSRLVYERTRQLEEANQELETKNEQLDDFAYIASHDLQEPLRKIIIFNNIIQERFELTKDLRMYINKSSASATRMNELIKNLLDYSRLSGSQKRMDKVDLAEALKLVLLDYEILIEQKKAVIKYDQLQVIEAIPLQMNQLFFNLIGNSLKFTQTNVEPVITITGQMLPDQERNLHPQLEASTTYYKIIFKDNGIGFNQEYASKIFTIFQRLNERTQYGGYGIGLALCRKIVETHKGIIYAASLPRQGATFTVILPVHQNKL